MHNHHRRIPLEHATLPQVHIRVTYQLIRLHAKRHPEFYGAFPANGIMVLVKLLEKHNFGALAAYGKAASRHVAGGMPMRTWRDLSPWDWKRSVFKQRWR